MVYLIPSFLTDHANETIPAYVMDAINKCQVVFAENIRTARRFLKALDPAVHIDGFEWHALHKIEEEQLAAFRKNVKANKNIAIISEAGCPGIADPGQILINEAHLLGTEVKPLVGPSSILLALMASGLNGQQFCFHGYLPVDFVKRSKAIRRLDKLSAAENATQIFIETPYRNKALLDALIKELHGDTRLCIAINLTAKNEIVKTLPVKQWKNEVIEMHKQPAIFLLLAAPQESKRPGL